MAIGNKGASDADYTATRAGEATPYLDNNLPGRLAIGSHQACAAEERPSLSLEPEIPHPIRLNAKTEASDWCHGWPRTIESMFSPGILRRHALQ